MSNKELFTYENIETLYNDNKELINNIKDGLFSSGFIPHDGKSSSGNDSNIENSIFLTYNNKQLLCSNDPQGEKLQSIQNVHDDVIDYFMQMNERWGSYTARISISFRMVYGNTIIDFEFLDKKSPTHVGLIYTDAPKEVWGEIHLEDNWYAYKYTMD
jgi:hypothetical protein